MRFNLSRSGCDGIVFDGFRLSDIFVVEDVVIPALPEITAKTMSLAQRAGEYYCSDAIGPRPVKITLRVDAESRCPLDIFKAWREVSGRIRTSEPRKLQLDEQWYCWAKLTGSTEIERRAYYGVVEATFTCFDPYFYGPTRKLSLASGLNEFAMACEAYPVLELTASGSSVRVQDERTGDFVLVDGLSSGKALTIDMERQCCSTPDGFRECDLMSDFFALSGDVRLRVTGASGVLSYQEKAL